ncbi:hypothetical protein BJ684DRAFT_20536, partial [Piptocephalis cylindrospora]
MSTNIPSPSTSAMSPSNIPTSTPGPDLAVDLAPSVRYRNLHRKYERLIKENVQLSEQLEIHVRLTRQEREGKRSLQDRLPRSRRSDSRQYQYPVTDPIIPEDGEDTQATDVTMALDESMHQDSDAWDSEDPLPPPPPIKRRRYFPPRMEIPSTPPHFSSSSSSSKEIIPSQEEKTPEKEDKDKPREPRSFIPIEFHRPNLVLPPPPNNWSLPPPPPAVTRIETLGRYVPEDIIFSEEEEDEEDEVMEAMAKEEEKAVTNGRPLPGEEAIGGSMIEGAPGPSLVDISKGLAPPSPKRAPGEGGRKSSSKNGPSPKKKGKGQDQDSELSSSTIPVNVFPTAKPRRMNKVITHTRRVPRIKRDSSGKPILPLKVGILRLISVGTIMADRPEFHNERYIWPVGYKVSRPFASLIHKDRDTTVTCTVLDGGNGPRFML